MKKLQLIFAFFGAFAISQAMQTAFGQTNNPNPTISGGATNVTIPSDIPSFVNTAFGYFTSFNTNLLTFSNGFDRVDISTGTENWQNNNLLALFHVDAQIYAGFRGVATIYNKVDFGAVSKADAGVAYAFVIYDTKLTASVNAGNDWDRHTASGYVRPDLELLKAMTQHTFAGINLGLPIYFGGQGDLTPNYGARFGFNF